jgi:hypothetical protein
MPNGFEFGEWASAQGFPVKLKSSAHEPTVLYYERVFLDGATARVTLPPDGFYPELVLCLDEVRFLCDRLGVPRSVFALILE